MEQYANAMKRLGDISEYYAACDTLQFDKVFLITNGKSIKIGNMCLVAVLSVYQICLDYCLYTPHKKSFLLRCH